MPQAKEALLGKASKSPRARYIHHCFNSRGFPFWQLLISLEEGSYVAINIHLGIMDCHGFFMNETLNFWRIFNNFTSHFDICETRKFFWSVWHRTHMKAIVIPIPTMHLEKWFTASLISFIFQEEEQEGNSKGKYVFEKIFGGQLESGKKCSFTFLGYWRKTRRIKAWLPLFTARG